MAKREGYPTVDDSLCTPLPHVLFFTGGTALRRVSQRLASLHFPSSHLVTMFDSGGSTAELRRCLAIPALGDMRNRLLALADPAALPPSVETFFQMRLSLDAQPRHLERRMRALALPSHPFWSNTPSDDVSFLTTTLKKFLDYVPRRFDWRGASVGNCILAALFVSFSRQFEPVLNVLHAFLHVTGRVIPVVEESLNLGCVLEDGTSFVGQHKFKAIRQRIRRIFLTVHEPSHWDPAVPDYCVPRLAECARRALVDCDVICYPMGSFYSSILVNLLLRGVGTTIAQRTCPKIFIPNVGFDPELQGCSLIDQCTALLAALQRDAPLAAPADFLNIVLIDSAHGDYQGRCDEGLKQWLRSRGILLCDEHLCCEPTVHDPALTLAALFRCARSWKEHHGN